MKDCEQLNLASQQTKNRRLFVGSLPKDKETQDVKLAMKELVQGVQSVIMYPSQQDKTKNRGYAFVEFDTHQHAVEARDYLQDKPQKLWGSEIKVDWAEPENEVDEETMSKVRILFVRNLDVMTTEDTLRKTFAEFGLLERVRKQNDYAFIHFQERRDAETALRTKHLTMLDGCKIEVLWSKPVKDPVQYKLKRADKFQASSSSSFNPLQNPFQQYFALQPQLLQSPLMRPSTPYLRPLGMDTIFQDQAALQMYNIHNYNLAAQHAPQFSSIGFPVSTSATSLLGQPVSTDSYSEESSRLGSAPGAVRTTVSPHVQTRPYPAPNTAMQHAAQHHQQQQQQQQQQAIPSALALQHPMLQHIPVLQATQGFQSMFPTGTDFAALNYSAAAHPFTAMYNPAAAAGTNPAMLPLLQGQEFLRQSSPYTEQ